MNARRVLRQLSAGFLAGASLARALAAPNPVALELVALTRLQEREVEAIRFMIEVSPLELPPHTRQCMLSRSAPAFTDYFANVFSRGFTDSELREAVAFFSSTEGASAVAAQRAYERSTFEAAVQRKSVDSQEPSYPPAAKQALDEFGKTAAGGKFDRASLAPAPGVAGESTSDLRSRLLSECLRAP
jgi:hypothetical protein